MSIERDFTPIENKVNSIKSKEGKIDYLHQLLFKRKKKLAEFKRGDLEILKMLRIKTKDDYEKCLDEEFKGNLFPHFHPLTDAATAKRLGLENIELLGKRLELEFDYKQLCEEIEIFEAKIIEVERMEINNEHSKEKIHLSSIFNNDSNAFDVCKVLLEEMELTIDGKPNPHMKKGRVGKLTGLITAIKNTPGMLILDKPKEKELLSYFNSYLDTDYKTFSKRNEDYSESLDSSMRAIKLNFKK